MIERVKGYHRGDLLEYEPEGYELKPIDFRPRRGDKKEEWFRDWATHAICLWGSTGTMVTKETWKKPFVNGVQLSLTEEQAEVVRRIDFLSFADRTRTSMPHLSWPEVVTAINHALRAS